LGDGQTSTQQNPSHTYVGAGPYTAVLTVTDAFSQQDTDSVDITVFPNPTASAGADFTSGVAPLTVNFSGAASGGTAPYTYEWQFGDGQSSTQQNPSHTYAAGSFTAVLTVTDANGCQDTDSLDITVSEPTPTPTATPTSTATPTPTPTLPPSGPNLSIGTASGVASDGWTTVTLPRSYSSMVVVASANYDKTLPPLVVRIQNAAGSSFDLRVDRADNSTTPVTGVDVHYMVVEEGVYNEAQHGVKMEAVKFLSTRTDENSSWVGENRAYQNAYNSPVVVGQVMTYNDPDFSAFWATGSSRSTPPSATYLYVGKHVAEDPDNTRADEVIGYVVLEAGNGDISGWGYEAGVGTDTVKGVGNTPPYFYALHGLQTASAAVVSSAAMDGSEGGWPVLYGAGAVTGSQLNLGIDEDNVYDSERGHTTEQVAYIVFGTRPQPGADPHLQRGIVQGVDNTAWTTVNLPRSYASMVVVASANYDKTMPPLAVRVRNAAGSSFDVRVDRADTSTAAVSPVDVHYMVVEEGFYTLESHGVKMEAYKYTSTRTDENNSWVGERRSYVNTYSSPVVLGQVMTYNDPAFSVFWARGSSRSVPPSGTVLYAGKHVGEDPDNTRADELIGYVVFEAGSGSISGLDYLAGVGADTVRGLTNAPPYRYTLSGLATTSAAVVSAAGQDASEGGWPMLYGANPVTTTTLNLAYEEDNMYDSERSHTTDQVAYIVFE
jgi:PKD repeat protein